MVRVRVRQKDVPHGVTRVAKSGYALEDFCRVTGEAGVDKRQAARKVQKVNVH